MSDAKKKYVVVFDQIGVDTGERIKNPNGPDQAVVKDYFRGDTVELSKEDAERHLEHGAVIEASDSRAKLIQPNEPLRGGVKRDPQVGVVELEQHEAAVAGGEGASRSPADYGSMKVTELKAEAKRLGVTVERGDDKAKLAAKLQEHADGLRAGQGKDESPPPEHQPGDE